mmetsp:Transcript_6552/g.21125  ORF Transcript_6552/g.21125 Transcript_6552/m.21125 type:complete len:213 (+) Transcript_6552:146-784(+)
MALVAFGRRSSRTRGRWWERQLTSVGASSFTAMTADPTWTPSLCAGDAALTAMQTRWPFAATSRSMPSGPRSQKLKTSRAMAAFFGASSATRSSVTVAWSDREPPRIGGVECATSVCVAASCDHAADSRARPPLLCDEAKESPSSSSYPSKLSLAAAAALSSITSCTDRGDRSISDEERGVEDMADASPAAGAPNAGDRARGGAAQSASRPR